MKKSTVARNTYPCLQCDHQAKRKDHLQRHVEVHHSTKPREKTVTCPIPGCEYKTYNQHYLRNHFNHVHTDERRFSCSIPGCSYKAKTTTHLREHEASHDTEKKYRCSLCRQKFRLQSHVDAHVARINRKKDDDDDDVPEIQCDWPGCSFKDRLLCRVNFHKKSHSQEKPFKCPTCPFSCAREGNLKKHVERHDEANKTFACTFCTYTAFAQIELTRHVRTHTGETPFSCDFDGCTYSAKDKGTLDKHKITHNTVKAFKCPVEGCPYAAKSQRNLSRHKMKHATDRPFKCTSCPYAAKTSSTLREHVRFMHMSEKNLKCSFPNCEYKTNRPEVLNRHEASHTEDLPYKCSVCDARFKSPRYLSKHETLHTGEKPFACSLCPFRARESKTLAYHVRTHTGETPFSCKYCDYRAKSSSAISSHEKKVHKGKD